MEKVLHNKIFLYSCLIILLLIPLSIAVQMVFSGNIHFWYDPARDFLAAQSNIHKLTLIGPTSGIPGIFYGPYWIWLLSFPMLFTFDPKIVIFIAVTLPYFTLFPLLLYKFKKLFGLYICAILWITYILGPGLNYAINPWNPYPAPLLFLALVYFLTFLDIKKLSKWTYGKLFLIGLLNGLLINFHISFGLGVFVGTLLYVILTLFINKIALKNTILLVSTWLLGIIIPFIPFFLFEIRHGFNQIQTALHVLSSDKSVVSVTGISKGDIINNFFGSFGSLLQIPLVYGYILLFISLSYYIIKRKEHNVVVEKEEKRLHLLLLCVSLGILALYLSSKNPVWGYHFIGVEIIFLLLLGSIIHNNFLLKTLFTILALGIAVNAITSNIYSLQRDPRKTQTLAADEDIVRSIKNDAKNNEFSVIAYSQSVYTYEYSYLLKWLLNKDVPYDPHLISKDEKLYYLIIPSDTPNKEDFIESYTPKAKYKSVKSWKTPNGTNILRMQNK